MFDIFIWISNLIVFIWYNYKFRYNIFINFLLKLIIIN